MTNIRYVVREGLPSPKQLIFTHLAKTTFDSPLPSVLHKLVANFGKLVDFCPLVFIKPNLKLFLQYFVQRSPESADEDYSVQEKLFDSSRCFYITYLCTFKKLHLDLEHTLNNTVHCADTFP